MPLLAALAVAPFALAQNPLPQTPRRPRPNQPTQPGQPTAPVPAQQDGQGGGGGRFGQRAPQTGPRPYDEVVTKDAKSDPGIFTVHRIGERILFEIPKAQMSKEMLLATEVAGSPAGAGGYGGTAAGHKVVRFTRRENSIYMRAPDYSNRAEGTGAIARAVTAANVEPILAVFPVEAEGKDGSVVIDVTRFFTSDPPEFSVRAAVGGGAVDPTRSYVDRIKSFPTNVEINSTLTFTGGTGAAIGGPGGPAGGFSTLR